jgi:hypothetical protein
MPQDWYNSQAEKGVGKQVRVDVKRERGNEGQIIRESLDGCRFRHFDATPEVYVLDVDEEYVIALEKTLNARGLKFQVGGYPVIV